VGPRNPCSRLLALNPVHTCACLKLKPSTKCTWYALDDGTLKWLLVQMTL
jgi:hypothetical protein